MQPTESAGWWVGNDDSHGVGISIAGGVVEMVRAQLLGGFCFFFIFYIMRSLFLSTRSFVQR